MAPLSDVVAGNVALASDVQQFKNLLTGAMTDQPVTLASVANLPRMSTGTNVLLVRPNVEYAYNGGNITGTMKITLPFGWTGTMMRVVIGGYTLDSNGPWQVVVGGYNYAGSPQAWWSPRADILGKVPSTSVRVGYDGTRCCILLGITSTVWSLPQVRVTQALLGFGGLTNDWTTGWSISVITDETGITNIVNVPVDAAVSCRQNASRLEYATGSTTGPAAGGIVTVTVSWSNAFSAVSSAGMFASTNDSRDWLTTRNGSLSATGASVSGYVNNGSTDCICTARWIAIGS